MDLSKIKVKTKNKNPKRLGRGSGSGTGKTAGRGHKGAGQRKGKRRPYPGFTGGNLPYSRRIPKRGFKSFSGKDYQIVNLKNIQEKLKTAKEVDPKVLKEVNLIKDEKKLVKILAKGADKFNIKSTLKADKFSSQAKKIIEEAGGKTECLKR